MDSFAALRVGTAFETLLLAPVLQTIFAEADVVGAYGVTLVAGELAAHDAHGFAAAVAGALERRR